MGEISYLAGLRSRLASLINVSYLLIRANICFCGFFEHMRGLKSKIKILAICVLIAGFLAAGFLAVWISTFKIPDLQSFNQRILAQSTKIYDRTGETLLFDLSQNIKRTIVPIEEISEHIKKATLAIEDADFYNHGGVQIRSTIRAILVNIGSLGFRQGGSTITQQVIKNSLLTTEKRISRKIKEWVLAVKLENVLTKDEILAIYLNESPYGGNLYGVEEASSAFFGKKASEVTLVEAAYLAALPQAPSFYSPYQPANRERLENRKNLVLREMLRHGFINTEEYERALEEKTEFRSREDAGIKAPHFVMFVKETLEEKYGQQVLETGGLKVITTLDYEIQKKAEDLAKNFALRNTVDFNAENISLVAVSPKTGEILTMVGSRDYFDEEIDGNFNVATAYRQPGSAFKPFAYAAAFNKGYTPETSLFDLPTVFTAGCSPQGVGVNCYAPQNYDNVFRGPMTMREALAQSVNVPSVKTLYLAGLQQTLSLARAMGIQNLKDANQYGLTLVLGGGEVSLLDLVSAYGVFANDGVRIPYNSVLEISDSSGKILEKANVEPRIVLQENIARKISDVLSDNTARAPAFGQNSPLNFQTRQVAVKTGTTNDYRDAWIVGYTPSLAVGAWAGNNDNRPMEKQIAGFIIAPFWRAFMDEVLPLFPDERFSNPLPDMPTETEDLKPVLRGIWQGGESFFIDRISGKLATEFTPKETMEEVVIGEVRTILHWLDKDAPRGPRPANPARDPQYSLWDFSVREWVVRQGIKELTENDVPKEYDDVHIPARFPTANFSTPNSGSRFDLNQRINVSLNTGGFYPRVKTEFFLNEGYLGNSENGPNFTFSFVPVEVGALEGENTLKAVVYDSVFNRAEVEADFVFLD